MRSAALALVLALAGAPVRADEAVERGASPEWIARAIEAFVAAGGPADDDALVAARASLAQCRADLAARRPEEAQRRCRLAAAELALARERALLALARARAPRRDTR